ncbi:MAG: fibronectin type III domain-containing protein [Bacteroidales bacterium]
MPAHSLMNLCSHSARPVRPPRTGPPRPRSSFLVLLALAAVLVGPLVACGKKAPPLPPLVRLPAASQTMSARRLGDTVYLQFAVPSRNQDNSTPADLTRVNVYGYTGTPASDDDLVKYGTLVATIPVRKPLTEEEQAAQKESADKKPAADNKAGVQREPGVDQGAAVAVSEKLTPALLQPVVRPPSKTKTPPASAGAAPPAASQVITRVYAAVGFNHKGRRGSFSPRAAVSVAPVPPPPTGVKLTYTESQITLAWTPPPTAGEGGEAPSSGTAPPEYNVYAVSSASPPGAAPAAGAEGAPAPLNDKPSAGTTYSDPRVEFGTERCYVVRTVATSGNVQVESEPSEVACVTPKDVFPPAAPKGLTAVTSAGAINLLWEPNTEPDLAGYLVLRGEAPGVTLQPITAQPIKETTFNDATAKAGVRYVYAIVAVDKSGNIGAQSNKVEETGR